VKKLIVLVVLLALVGVGAFAQTTTVNLNLQAVALIGVYDDVGGPNPTISLALLQADLSAPGDAWATPDTNDTEPVYIRYTIIQGITDSEIQVAITAGSVPTGTQLLVTTAPTVTGGQGAVFGTGVTNLVLSGTATDAITLIRNWATGTGNTNGAAVTYTFRVNPVGGMAALVPSSGPVTVTYTVVP
jgi:hypothetical protein